MELKIIILFYAAVVAYPLNKRRSYSEQDTDIINQLYRRMQAIQGYNQTQILRRKADSLEPETQLVFGVNLELPIEKPFLRSENTDNISSKDQNRFKVAQRPGIGVDNTKAEEYVDISVEGLRPQAMQQPVAIQQPQKHQTQVMRPPKAIQSKQRSKATYQSSIKQPSQIVKPKAMKKQPAMIGIQAKESFESNEKKIRKPNSMGIIHKDVISEALRMQSLAKNIQKQQHSTTQKEQRKEKKVQNRNKKKQAEHENSLEIENAQFEKNQIKKSRQENPLVDLDEEPQYAVGDPQTQPPQPKFVIKNKSKHVRETNVKESETDKSAETDEKDETTSKPKQWTKLMSPEHQKKLQKYLTNKINDQLNRQKEVRNYKLLPRQSVTATTKPPQTKHSNVKPISKVQKSGNVSTDPNKTKSEPTVNDYLKQFYDKQLEVIKTRETGYNLVPIVDKITKTDYTKDTEEEDENALRMGIENVADVKEDLAYSMENMDDELNVHLR